MGHKIFILPTLRKRLEISQEQPSYANECTDEKIKPLEIVRYFKGTLQEEIEETILWFILNSLKGKN